MCFVFFGLSMFLNASGFQVEPIKPIRNSMDVSKSLDLVSAALESDFEIDWKSINADTFLIHGAQTGFINGEVDYDVATYKITHSVQNRFYAGDVVTVWLTNGVGFINSIPTQGYAWQFWIETRQASGNFIKDQEIFTNEESDTSPGICIADLNGDGALDIGSMLSGFPLGGSLGILFNDGHGNFNDSFDVLFDAGFEPTSINCQSDMDNDGDLDIVYTGGYVESQIRILTNDGQGNFNNKIYDQTLGVVFRAVKTCDINLDGTKDFVAVDGGKKVDNNILIGLNDGTGTPKSIIQNIAQDAARRVECVDMNNDGLFDLVVTNEDVFTVSIFYNQGQSDFSVKQDLSFEGKLENALVRDVDSDGDLDIVVLGYHDTVFVFKNNGNQNFVLDAQYNVPGILLDIYANDLDGDTDIDLAVIATQVELTNAYVYVLYNLSDGTFQNPIFSETTQTPKALDGGDFDNDGDIDLAVNILRAKTIDSGAHIEIFKDIKLPYIATDQPSLIFESVEALSNDENKTQTFQINNTGDAPLEWSIEHDADWVNCDPCHGIDSADVKLTINIQGFAPGTYFTELMIVSDTANNSPVIIPIELNIAPKVSAPAEKMPLRKKDKGGFCGMYDKGYHWGELVLVLLLMGLIRCRSKHAVH